MIHKVTQLLAILQSNATGSVNMVWPRLEIKNGHKFGENWYLFR